MPDGFVVSSSNNICRIVPPCAKNQALATTASPTAFQSSGRPGRPLTTATRSDVLPDIPTLAEFVPGYEASTWFGVGAPKNTPAEIVEKLNKDINAGLADPTIKARLADLGGVPMPMSAGEFGKFIADETEKWAKVVKFSGAKPN
jgi:tripartite-type tricarboxylate transporter receptor subunit TctC